MPTVDLALTDANGTVRNNKVYEPTSPNGKGILALHGGLGSPLNFQTTSQLDTLFPFHTICYADADDTINNLWRSNQADLTDVRFLTDLIDEFCKQHDIAYSDMGVIGISNGTMMAGRLLSVLDEMGIEYMVGVSGTYNAPETFDFCGRILMINSYHDAVVPYLGDANNTPVQETIETMKSSAIVFEQVLDRTEVSDPDFNYHAWAEIKQIYPNLDQRIQQFVGV